MKEILKYLDGAGINYTLDSNPSPEKIEMIKKSIERQDKRIAEKLNKEALDYMIFGAPSRYLNEALLDEMKSFIKIDYLSVDEIVDRFGELLTEKDIENLKKLRGGK